MRAPEPPALNATVPEVRHQHPEPEDRDGQNQLEGAVPGPGGGRAVPGARGADATRHGQRGARVVCERGHEEGGAARCS